MELTKAQMDAVEMLFDGQMTDTAIAEKVGIDVRTLSRWQKIPEFAAEFSCISDEYKNSIKQRSVIYKVRRLDAKLDRYRRLRCLIIEREKAADPNVAGDCTGLITKRIVNTKNGVLIEARLDMALLREISRLENEIAKELDNDTPIPENRKREPNINDFINEGPDFPDDFLPVAEGPEPRTHAPSLNRAARRQAERKLNKSRTPHIPGQNRTLDAAA